MSSHVSKRLSTQGKEDPEERQHRLRWLALLSLGLGFVMTIIDVSVVNVTTPAIQDYFNATATQMEWVVAAYTVTFAALLLPFGRLASKQGLKLYQWTGAGLFGLASLGIALAPSIQLVNVFRVVEGIGAAANGVTGIALLNHIFKGEERAKAFGIWGALAGLGVAVGPILGGVAVDMLQWQFAFFINVPIAVLVIIGTFLFVNEIKDPSDQPFDMRGALLIGGAMLLGVFSLIQGPSWGWVLPKDDSTPTLIGLSPVVYTMTLAVILGLIAYPHWFQKLKAAGRTAIFDIELFRLKSFRGGMMASFFRQIAQFAVAYGVAIYLQEVAGFSALQTGFAFLGMAITCVIGGLVSGRIAGRSGTRPVVLGGLILQVLGTLVVALVLAAQAGFWPVFLALAFFGLGQSGAAAQLNSVVLADVPVEESGDGGAANSTIRQLGNSVGTALVGGAAAINPALVMVLAILIGGVAVFVAFGLPNVKGGGGIAEA